MHGKDLRGEPTAAAQLAKAHRRGYHLCRRLQDQVNIAEALEAAARPHDDVTVSEYPMLKVLELAAAQHAAELRQVTGLAKIISERRPA
jgi:hypothetical protein